MDDYEKRVEIEIANLEGPVDEVIAYLQSLPKIHHQYKDFELEWIGDYEDAELMVIGIRDETETEKNARLELEKKRQELKRIKAEMLKLKETAN